MAMEEEDDGGGIPEWVVTFGDMMSLLLTFFIMLVSLSEIKDEEKYQAMVESMVKQFGYESAMQSFAPGRSKPRNSQIAKIASDGRSRRMNVMQGGDKVQAPVGDFPHVRIVRPGEKTHYGTVVFFEEGSAELTEQCKQDLAVAVKAIGGKPQKIELRGHTSKRPLDADSAFKNHWDLAYQRSWNVLRQLVDLHKIDNERIRISVAGPYEPMHISPDQASQKSNPRVEIYMLNEVVSDLMGTKDELDQRFMDEEGP